MSIYVYIYSYLHFIVQSFLFDSAVRYGQNGLSLSLCLSLLLCVCVCVCHTGASTKVFKAGARGRGNCGGSSGRVSIERVLLYHRTCSLVL